MDEPARRDILKLLGAGAVLPLPLGALAAAHDRPGSALSELARDFGNPPPQARPGIFWYWLNGNVTREGITADLEAMAANGLRTVMLFSIGGEGPDTLVSPSAQSLTPPWWALLRFAVGEAARLGLEMALNACDGWATASGPWITPELSMQKLTWSELDVVGGQRLARALHQPPIGAGYYRDLRVVAFPHPQRWEEEPPTPHVSGMLAGANGERLLDPANKAVVVDSEAAGEIVLRYDRPVTLRSLTVRTPPFPGPFAGVQRAANTLFVEASDDGAAWRAVTRLGYPRHGWQTALTELTHALPPTRARMFRFRYTPEAAPAHREDLFHAGEARLRLIGLVPSTRPRVSLLPIRTGEAWGKADRLDEHHLPASDCVPLASLIDLTDRLGPDGMLDWTPPAGRWTVLRIGHTSTGKANSMAGGGKGLECDKLSRAAARVQFEGWFGEALKTVGPELAGKVLHVFHVDSWEAGSQNWTPAYPDRFRRRRGYDLLPQLAILAGVPIGSADHVERILFDHRRTIGELVQDEFFGELAGLAKANNCLFSAETVNPTMIADGLDYGAAADVPMGEFWLRSPQNEKPHDIADAVSSAHIHGRRIAGSEAFTEWDLKWDETPWLLKARGDHHYAAGINRFCLHVYAHQPWLDRAPGVTLMGVGTFFGRTQTWWRQGRAWIDYLARSQALLQSGDPVADVAMFIGEDVPARSVLADALPVTLPAGYRHDSINREALLRRARVEAAALVLPGGMRYRMLLLPDADRMTPELAERLAGFAAAGLPIVGRAPIRSPGGGDTSAMDARVAAAGRVMRLIDYTDFPAALARTCAPDLLVQGNGHAIEWTSRAGPGWRLYYLSNQSDAPVVVEADMRGLGRPHRWRPDSGATEPIADWRNARDRTQIAVALDARGTVFVLVEEGASAQPHPAPPAREHLRMPVAGGWRVTFPGVGGRAWPNLARWDTSAEEAIRHFSGTARYELTLRCPDAGGLRWLLDLGEVADLAEIWVNDRPLGVLWKPPFVVDVTGTLKRGDNKLVIAVTNTWRNRLIGDANRADRTSFVTPALHFGKPWQPLASDPLSPAGLIGPVTLRGVDREIVP